MTVSSLNRRLIKAAMNGDLDDATEFIADHADVNGMDEKKRTPLYYAASNGDLDMIKLLLAYQADPNAPSPPGLSPLVAAVQFQRFDAADLLLKNGAKLDFMTGPGKATALHYAVGMDAEKGKTDRVRFLMERGADAHLPSVGRVSALELAREMAEERPEEKPGAQAVADLIEDMADPATAAARQDARRTAAFNKAVHGGTGQDVMAVRPLRLKTGPRP